MHAGRIDQVNQVFEKDVDVREGVRFASIANWTTQLNTLFNTIAAK
jgi:hypothetical protein